MNYSHDIRSRAAGRDVHFQALFDVVCELHLKVQQAHNERQQKGVDTVSLWRSFIRQLLNILNAATNVSLAERQRIWGDSYGIRAALCGRSVFMGQQSPH